MSLGNNLLCFCCRRHVEDGNISVNTKDDWDNSPL